MNSLIRKTVVNEKHIAEKALGASQLFIDATSVALRAAELDEEMFSKMRSLKREIYEEDPDFSK